MSTKSSTAHPLLVQTMRDIRHDARSDPKPTEVAAPFTIAFTFDGATLPPLVGDDLILPLGKISGRIVGATMASDTGGSASIDLRLGNVASWPTAAPIYDTVPTLSGGAVELSTTNWKVNLQPGDILKATLMSVSGLTSVTLALECIRLKWPSGSAGLIDRSGNHLIDSAGNRIVQRN